MHDDVAQVVDQWLRGYPVEPEVRHMNEDGNITRTAATRQNEAAPTPWAANEIRGRRGRNRNGRGQDTYEQYPPERFPGRTRRQRVGRPSPGRADLPVRRQPGQG